MEGQIKEGDAAWESVPPGDRPRRKRAVDDKARERPPQQPPHRRRLDAAWRMLSVAPLSQEQRAVS